MNHFSTLVGKEQHLIKANNEFECLSLDYDWTTPCKYILSFVFCSNNWMQ